MQTVLKNIADEHLKAYIVWLPVLPGDNRDWAQTRSEEFSDPRLTYYWDGEQLSGNMWRNVLGMPRLAWDVYFLYGGDAGWEDWPAPPDFWMHQLGGLSGSPRLDVSVFEQQTRLLLEKIKVAQEQ